MNNMTDEQIKQLIKENEQLKKENNELKQFKKNAEENCEAFAVVESLMNDRVIVYNNLKNTIRTMIHKKNQQIKNQKKTIDETIEKLEDAKSLMIYNDSWTEDLEKQVDDLKYELNHYQPVEDFDVEEYEERNGLI